MTSERSGEGSRLAPMQIGPWVVEPERGTLTRDEKEIRLRSRAMGVLIHLAERDGEVASKAELMGEVWPDEVVSDGALSRTISELRSAFGDPARNPSIIETVPGLGYRLMVPVVDPTTSVPEKTQVLPAGDRFWLVSKEGPIELREGENVIGRTADAVVRIDSSRVSRRHARIVIEGGTAVIEDLGSTNGTFLRNRRINTPLRLIHGDDICIGMDIARYRFVADDPGSETT